MADAAPGPEPGPAGRVDIGSGLRRRREERGLSLRELARRIGVSASLVSQIETGKVRPSVSTLYAMAAELEASLDELLFNDPATAATLTPGPHPVDDHPHVPPVQRADDRKVLHLASGVRWERLTTESVPGIDFLYVVYEPGGGSSPPDAMQRHAGREWGYIVRGTLHVTIAGEDHVLHPGDSITFDSTLPHRLWNPGAEDVHGVWFVLGRRSPAT